MHELLTSTTLESHLRVVSGVLIACCVKKLIKSHAIFVTEDMKISFLQVMSLTVLSGEKELGFLQSLLKTSEGKLVCLIMVMMISFCCIMCRTIVLDALFYYVKTVIDMKRLTHVVTIVKALPLYHFLSGLSKPNQPLQVSLQNVAWCSRLWDFTVLKDFIEDKPG